MALPPIPPPGAPVSADAKEGARAVRHSALIASITALAVAAITGTTTYFIGRNTAPVKSDPPSESLSISIDPLDGGEIDYPYQTLTGSVTGLRAGQMVWTFSQFATK